MTTLFQQQLRGLLKKNLRLALRQRRELTRELFIPVILLLLLVLAYNAWPVDGEADHFVGGLNVTKALSAALPAYLTVIFSQHVRGLVTRIVDEKERGFDTLFRAAGLLPAANVAAWAITTTARTLFVCLLVVLFTTVGNVLPQTNALVLGVFFLLAATANATFAMVMSRFFSKARLGGLLAGMITVGMAGPAYLVIASSSTYGNGLKHVGLQVVISLLPPSGLALGIRSFAEAERNARGTGWSDLSQSDHGDSGVISILAVAGMLVLDAVLLGAVAWLLAGGRFCRRRSGQTLEQRDGSLHVSTCLTRVMMQHPLPAVYGVGAAGELKLLERPAIIGDDKEQPITPPEAESVWDVLRSGGLLVEARTANMAAHHRSPPEHFRGVWGEDLWKVYPIEPVPVPGLDQPGVEKRPAGMDSGNGPAPALFDGVAAAHVDIVVPYGQLTCVLGQNGAGKSTTMNMLIGAITATQGTVAAYDGEGGQRTVGAGGTGVGVCFQHDVLFEALNALEHVQLMGQLRGLGAKEAKDEATALLKRLGLAKMQYQQARRLSGGQKRRVCLAMALVGDPAFICLDECTAGVDPQSRRRVWELLRERRLSCAMLMTTHVMNEADALADQIYLMYGGEQRVVGSPYVLKLALGAGYRITLEGGEEDGDRLDRDALQQCLEPLSIPTLMEATSGRSELGGGDVAVLRCSSTAPEHVAEVLAALAGQRDRIGYSTARMDLAALDEVFQTVVGVLEGHEKGNADEDDEESGSAQSVGPGADLQSPRGVSVQMTLQDTVDPDCGPMQPSFGRALRIVLWRRWRESTRDPQGVWLRVVLPLVIFIIAVVIRSAIRSATDDNRPNATTVGRVVCATPGKCFEEWDAAKGLWGTWTALGFYIAASLATSPAMAGVVPVLERASGVRTLQRVMGLQPAAYWLGLWMWELLMFSFTLIGAVFLIWLAGPRELVDSGSLGAFAVVLVAYGLAAPVTAYCIASKFSVPLTAQSVMRVGFYAAGGLFVAIIGISRGSISFASTLPATSTTIDGETAPSGASVDAINAVQAILSAFPPYAVAAATTRLAVRTAFQIDMQSVSEFRPNNTLLAPDAIQYVTSGSVWHWEAAGGPLAILCLSLPLWALLLLKLDGSGSRAKAPSRTTRNTYSRDQTSPGDEESGVTMLAQDASHAPTDTDVDPGAVQHEDVQQETERVAQAAETGDGDELSVLHLAKLFSIRTGARVGILQRLKGLCCRRSASPVTTSKTGVHDISFGVQAGEALGLLGTNGGGKTTTLKMLTGDLTPERGIFELGRHGQGGGSVGYVPQFGGLWALLTVEETLMYAATIKGVAVEHVPGCVNQVIDAVELGKWRHVRSSRLSGGNQRKLSLAIATVGGRQAGRVLLLDEVSSGMDPKTRQHIWQYLLALKASRAIVLTTHHLEEADALCDRVTVLMGGRLQAIGTPEGLKERFSAGYIATVHIGRAATSSSPKTTGAAVSVDALSCDRNAPHVTAIEAEIQRCCGRQSGLRIGADRGSEEEAEVESMSAACGGNDGDIGLGMDAASSKPRSPAPTSTEAGSKPFSNTEGSGEVRLVTAERVDADSVLLHFFVSPRVNLLAVFRAMGSLHRPGEGIEGSSESTQQVRVLEFALVAATLEQVFLKIATDADDG